MDVPIFRLKYDKKYREKFYEYCEQIFDRAYLTNDEFVSEFEKEFSQWTKASYSVAVSNGTAALEALLRAIDVEGKEVIIPTNTFIATAVAIRNAGGIPVLADIEKDYASLDPNAVESLINRNTKAIITVHIGGLISPSIRSLQEICKKHNLDLIEDCAHAHGSTFQGLHCGLFGTGGAFSFFTTKVLTTGEGGMSITSSQEVFNRLISIRQFGKEATNPISHNTHGNNLKMSEFQAALGLIEIERSKKKIKNRQAAAQLYQDQLKNSPWNPLSAHKESDCSYYKQILWPKNKKNICDFLESKSIKLTGGVYNIPLHRQPIFKSQYNDQDFPVGNHFSENHICPPCYADLSLEEVGTVCRFLLEYDN